ncbi:GNAT family N-acetyltransferase [Tychonema sp. LEGE 07203]|uniref:GNAT family N-acetyltransferase n=1 Tax=Tychonema sp. LEGE 07203 TaxID=1828671 RepID=UPI0018824812|nr:GNAT family N-acetyltransferase [Tychonema sp. LEGE 07203]MBE9094126.1 GNAT family N-acetyltransferase [Tychonema sp. LEGE 07203]
MTDNIPRYRIVETLTENQVSDLMDLYKNEFWCDKRRREDVLKMLAATDVIIGLVDEDDGVPPRKLRLIAFSRVITDFVYRAMIFDVIVKPTHRKTGLGAVLMDAVVNHPKLQAVETLALNCLPQMIPFYKRWGFTDNMGDIKSVRRRKP